MVKGLNEIVFERHLAVDAAKITAQGVNVAFSRDLARNRQYLLGEQIFIRLTARRRPATSSRGAFKSSESVISARDYGIICALRVSHTHTYIYKKIYIKYIYVRSHGKEGKKETCLPYTYAYMYTVRGGQRGSLRNPESNISMFSNQ